MANEQKPAFDPAAFLAKAGGGRIVTAYPQNQVVFAQGEPADAVFYIQKGQVKIMVVSVVTHFELGHSLFIWPARTRLRGEPFDHDRDFLD